MAATRGAGTRITVPASWIASWTLYDLANTIWSYGIFSYAIGLYLTSEGVLGESDGNLWLDRKSTRLNSSHTDISRMPSSA